MTQMWPLCSQKNTTTATSMAASKKKQDESATTTVATKSLADTSSRCYCFCLVTKLMRKLKRRSRTLRPASRQGLFQCHYDPLSYSLNFDTTGCGSLLDEDYYKFYAFSSRFVANPRTSCPIVPLAGSSH